MNYLEIWGKYKYYIIALIAIIILIIIIIITSNKKNKIQNTPLPTDSVGEELTEEDARTVRELTLQLYNDMKGIDWFGWLTTNGKNYSALESLAQLGDKLFVAVYNDFNNLYFSEGHGTLRNWINDEVYVANSRALHAATLINTKLNRLNLQ